MIYSLKVEDPQRACMPWWPQVPALKGRDSLDFAPGLNILWGPNGCGKSTVLRSIARMLHCEQGGTQVVTSTSAREIRGSGATVRDGVLPVHDGSPVMFLDPSDTVGLIGGGFDWDFGDKGFQNALFKGSHGETTLMRAEEILLCLVGVQQPPARRWKILEPGEEPRHSSKYAVETWSAERRMLEILEGTGKHECPTLLFDEPDRSLDAPSQYKFWENVVKHAKNQGIQVIATTHSVFALNLPDTNYIELIPGHLEGSVFAVARLTVRLSE